jgi:predicted nucleotidyltransferase component of viral defense system
MNPKGLTTKSLKVFEALKKSDLLQEYILIGGTALSVQINNRRSEDLDFSLLEPRYNVTSQDIQSFIREKIYKEYGPVRG